SISVGTRFPAHTTSMGRVLLAALAPDALTTHLDGAPFDARTPRTLHTRADIEAELVRVRSQGYALVDQELELGLRSIAVPVLAVPVLAGGGTGTGGTTRTAGTAGTARTARTAVAAVNVSVSAGTFTVPQMIETLLPPLRHAASLIAANLAAARTP
ncbi:MAG: IclR family transcriptional regulator, pca regulon regulatory protein, partial [Subtercola sp.]|nr:IclR family transcriptional regulator, pca regulon regulatory protein [Subtercola sp.]